MKTDLAPKYVSKISNSSILWFETSNQYIVISDALAEILNIYFDAETREDFSSQLQRNLDIPLLRTAIYYNEITDLLINSNSSAESEIQNNKSPLLPNHGIEEIYCFGNTVIKVSFGSEKIKALIHPQWAHAVLYKTHSLTCSFDIFKDGESLYLFKEHLYIGHYPLTDYHLLQGQFALQMINVLYGKQKADWIATFHASTVCNDKEAIMIIGDSGNGKSTLSAVLMANGLDVLADDYTPLSAENRAVYRFPSGISVKKGAFNILKPLFADFDKFPLYTSSSKNVTIKYIPPLKNFDEAGSHFPCTKIVYVKYDAQAKSALKEVSTEKILETLIPESWISPLASNSKLFLEWVKELQCFELNYSDNAIAVAEFKKLFNS